MQTNNNQRHESFIFHILFNSSTSSIPIDQCVCVREGGVNVPQKCEPWLWCLSACRLGGCLYIYLCHTSRSHAFNAAWPYSATGRSLQVKTAPTPLVSCWVQILFWHGIVWDIHYRYKAFDLDCLMKLGFIRLNNEIAKKKKKHNSVAVYFIYLF